MILHIDLETFSEEELKESGVYRYAEHPSTEVNCLGWRVDAGPVNQWIPFDTVPAEVIASVTTRHPSAVLHVGVHAPAPLLNSWHLPKRAHNAQFERVVLNGVAGKKLGLPPTKISEWVCTAAKVAAAGLPRALSDAAKALGTHAKSEAGRIEMMQLAKPKRATRADPTVRYTVDSAPGKWVAMLCYNIDDVLAEYDVDVNVPDLVENEQRLYELDQKINERGWAVDLKAVNDILAVVEEYKEQLADEFYKLTLTPQWDDDVGDFIMVGLSPTQREKIADWVRAKGYTRLPDMTAETIRCAIDSGGLPPQVARVLRIYSTYNAKSVSKLQAMLRAVCADGRLRGMFMFYGAATGRWSSLIVQLQNMMRPVIKDPNTAIEAFAERSLDLIRMLYPDLDPMKVAGSCIRGCLIASDGASLIAPDFSGIEDRVNLWFFDEEEMLQVYHDYDAGKGWHPYIITASRSFGIPLESQTKKQWDDDPRRQWGKVMRLALGYEGGVSAFFDMVETYGIDLEEMAKVVLPLLPEKALDHAKWMHENHPNSKASGDVETACNGLKYLWRQQQPRIVQGWKNLKEAAEKAVEFQGQAFMIPNRKIGFKVETYKGRKWLEMKLPSGRKIRYYDPHWTPPRESERWLNGVLEPYTIPGFMDYMGIDTHTRQWVRLQTYGGKLDENADQGFSRDLLCNALLALDVAGFTIVGSEHDKAILEIGDADSVDEVKRLMVTQPSYCEGLPLATDGKRLTRYGK